MKRTNTIIFLASLIVFLVIIKAGKYALSLLIVPNIVYYGSYAIDYLLFLLRRHTWHKQNKR